MRSNGLMAIALQIALLQIGDEKRRRALEEDKRRALEEAEHIPVSKAEPPARQPKPHKPAVSAFQKTPVRAMKQRPQGLGERRRNVRKLNRELAHYLPLHEYDLEGNHCIHCKAPVQQIEDGLLTNRCHKRPKEATNVEVGNIAPAQEEQAAEGRHDYRCQIGHPVKPKCTCGALEQGHDTAETVRSA